MLCACESPVWMPSSLEPYLVREQPSSLLRATVCLDSCRGWWCVASKYAYQTGGRALAAMGICACAPSRRQEVARDQRLATAALNGERCCTDAQSNASISAARVSDEEGPKTWGGTRCRLRRCCGRRIGVGEGREVPMAACREDGASERERWKIEKRGRAHLAVAGDRCMGWDGVGYGYVDVL